MAVKANEYTTYRPDDAYRAGSRGMFIAGGLLIGIGLGGFVDGIVLHQILQWHHMLTAHGHPMNTVDGLETNTLWDGLFHALTWVSTGAGIALLWHSTPFPKPGWGLGLFGVTLAGWGLFNLVEGIVDHHILTIHHVRDDVEDPLLWDLGFLALGAALLIGGGALAWRVLRSNHDEAHDPQLNRVPSQLEQAPGDPQHRGT